MSASRETANARKDDEKTATGDNSPPNLGTGTNQTHTPDQGEESTETNTRNRRGNHIRRSA